MRWKILGVLGTFLISASVLAAQPAAATSAVATNNIMTTVAADACGGSFLGLKPWHDGLCENGDIVPVCEKSESDCIAQYGEGNYVALQSFVWHVVLNILFDITAIIGYVAAAMIIYGGYLFMMSQGDPSRAAKGKKTLTSAIIGMVIAVGASIFINTAIQILNINRNGGWEQPEFTRETLNNIFSWAYAMAGLVAVGFIIKSGIEYMISTGDLGKTKKATHGLIYSVVGLVVVILAAVITGFVINSLGGAM